MHSLIALLCSAFAGYVCGATPFGYFAGRLKGLDIREHGSGNIGATNVIRVCGKGIGIPVFILDVIKGWLPVWLVQWWFATRGLDAGIVTTCGILAGVAAVMGHNYTFWLKGRGGKGIATSLGMLFGTAPIAALAGLGAFVLSLLITRIVSLSSMIAAVAVPVTMIVIMLRSGQWNFVLLGFGLLLCVLAIYRHKANIQRLLAGTEPKIGQKKPIPAVDDGVKP